MLITPFVQTGLLSEKMPKPRGWVSIDIRRETRDTLRRISQKLGKTYDETIRIALEALEIIETISRCRAFFMKGVRIETDQGSIDTSEVILKCNSYEVSIDPREYRKLRKILKILPKTVKTEGTP